MRTILFIDGENLKYKLKTVLKHEKRAKDFNIYEYDFASLFDEVLKGFNFHRKIFYGAKLMLHPETEKKSKELIEEQRLLKTHLEKQGFEFTFSGRVRGNIAKNHRGRELLTFKEKGVDVQIAVDMITMAYEGELKTAVIASSDSDLQPAIRVLKKKEIERVYVGFELEPNKGLTFTTNRTIIIRNSEVLKYLPSKLIDS